MIGAGMAAQQDAQERAGRQEEGAQAQEGCGAAQHAIT